MPRPHQFNAPGHPDRIIAVSDPGHTLQEPKTSLLLPDQVSGPSSKPLVLMAGLPLSVDDPRLPTIAGEALRLACRFRSMGIEAGRRNALKLAREALGIE